MDGADLLDTVVRLADGSIDPDKMPAGVLRFSLEYASVPDLDAERQRIAAALKTDAFSLARLADDQSPHAGRFLILQFAGVRRTLSSPALFEIANALREKLDLVSCEPDTGARIFLEPDDRPVAAETPESAVVDLWCWSNAPAPGDKGWSLNTIRAPNAWQISPKRGEGIVIAQPDTGIAQHSELEPGALLLSKAKNILEGGDDPKDPLLSSMANPGHGTAVASVVISRSTGQMTGAAPGAQLVPIRCINDVKIFDASPIAASMVHARRAGCDIITMSLGGFFSSSLRAAIADAVEAGMIVLAAAGNCVGFVVYPASDPNVIAVAGTDENDKPWKGSSSGSDVDISAPAENVYIARRSPSDMGDSLVTGGQGTSFAVALTAGVAALWLAHHGRDAVRAQAAARGITVNALFRMALQQTARKSPHLPADEFGPGIVNAEALLQLPLASIARGASPRPAPNTKIEAIAELASQRKVVEGFDWAAHGAEATMLAAQAAITWRSARAGVERPGARALRPSAKVEQTAPTILRELFGRATDADLAPGLVASPLVLARTLKVVGKITGGGQESAASVTIEKAQERLKGKHSENLLNKLDSVLRSLPGTTPEIVAERQKLVIDTAAGLRKLAKDGVNARLVVSEVVGLEGLVRLHDRPALRVQNSQINMEDPLLGDWAGALLPANHLLRPALDAVGRIDLDGVHIGTGFLIATNRVMTNRHVLEGIAEEFHSAQGRTEWVFSGSVTINFADDGLGNQHRFKIKQVIAAGPQRTSEILDFNVLDVAILEVESVNDAGSEHPDPLPLLEQAAILGNRGEILLAGYPARPGRQALLDPETHKIRDDVITRLGKIFGLAYSVKYLSPGEITQPLGRVPGDDRDWVVAHDATSLGGNSGSWVIPLGTPGVLGVIGLHFGGGTLGANYAHALAVVRQSGVLAAAGLDGVIWS